MKFPLFPIFTISCHSHFILHCIPITESLRKKMHCRIEFLVPRPTRVFSGMESIMTLQFIEVKATVTNCFRNAPGLFLTSHTHNPSPASLQLGILLSGSAWSQVTSMKFPFVWIDSLILYILSCGFLPRFKRWSYKPAYLTWYTKKQKCNMKQG